jgi:cytochrome aa3-600 menaquinol oxidase subunit 1
VALALMTFDRLFGALFHFGNGGMPMLWANLFWIWGHPEVYIVILAGFRYFLRNHCNICKKAIVRLQSDGLFIVAISVLSFSFGSPLLHNGEQCGG